MKKLLLGLALGLTSVLSWSAFAENIAFGTLEGIKVYDYANSKVTRLYFSDSATYQNVPDCNGVANITHSLHSPEALDQFVSIAFSAYIAGRKVRAFSSNDTCEVDFLAIQESFF